MTSHTVRRRRTRCAWNARHAEPAQIKQQLQHQQSTSTSHHHPKVYLCCSFIIVGYLNTTNCSVPHSCRSVTASFPFLSSHLLFSSLLFSSLLFSSHLISSHLISSPLLSSLLSSPLLSSHIFIQVLLKNIS